MDMILRTCRSIDAWSRESTSRAIGMVSANSADNAQATNRLRATTSSMEEPQ
jgi:hypothetical protein